ncbi:CHASE3 domain-containing protein [Micromonospora sp. CPCC 205371]|nr:CHASE3 domain-containing protein [Micromonospora sp. CPCC 205371]
MKGGLTRRVLLASGLLAAIIGTTFAGLLSTVEDLREIEARERRSERVLILANRLERLIVDMETGQRGFLLTGSEEFLQPWQAAQDAFPEHAATLERLVVGNPVQEARAQQISQAGTSYLRDYSIPLIDTARRDRASVATLPATVEGKRRVDAMRADFDQLLAAEEELTLARQRSSDTANLRAIIAAAAGLIGSVLLVALFATYLVRRVVRPVRRTSAMAGQLAAGDLSARVPDRGVGEIAVLQRSFNTMASALENGRRELAASRARIVAAGDHARRRIERDLHDGTQQRLVSLLLQVRAAEAVAPADAPQLKSQLVEVAWGLTGALDELRELSRGIHPAILSEGGLGPALKSLARRAAVPVELNVNVPTRLPEPVEVAAYFAVSEALTNAAKHAQASVVWVDAKASPESLRVAVRDDGVGGAEAGPGGGLIGLVDRVQALGGTISVTSPAGRGTTLVFDLPLNDR